MTSHTTETIPRPGAEAEATTPENKELQANADDLAASLPSTLTATLKLACNDAETVFNPDPADGRSRGLHAVPDGETWLARTFDGTCVACLAGAVVLTHTDPNAVRSYGSGGLGHAPRPPKQRRSRRQGGTPKDREHQRRPDAGPPQRAVDLLRHREPSPGDGGPTPEPARGRSGRTGRRQSTSKDQAGDRHEGPQGHEQTRPSATQRHPAAVGDRTASGPRTTRRAERTPTYRAAREKGT